MIEADQKAFGQVIVVLAEAFGERLSPERLALYFNALSDLTLDLVNRAAEKAARECRFFPKPVELRELVLGSADDAATRAWEIVLESVRAAACWDSIYLEDGFIGAAIVAVFAGWVECSDQVTKLSPEMVTAKRKEFIAAYRNAQNADRSINYLAGYHEINNRGSVGKWDHGLLSIGDQAAYRIPVYLAHQKRTVEALFDSTGRMIDSLDQLLISEPTKRRMITANTRAELPPVDPEVLKEGIQLLTRRAVGARSPVIENDEDWEARREHLKRQAESIGAVSREVLD